MRAFVALPLSAEVRSRAAKVQEELRRADADVRWTPEAQMHLTLKFLGEIDGAQEARIAAVLAEHVPRRPPMSLEFAGLGSFPPQGPPRVVWAGVRGDVGPLAELAELVERAAEEAGVPRESRPFSPHLTLGRVRSGRNLRRLEAALARPGVAELGRQEAGEVALFASTLGPSGAVHEPRSTFRCAGRSAAS